MIPEKIYVILSTDGSSIASVVSPKAYALGIAFSEEQIEKLWFRLPERERLEKKFSIVEFKNPCVFEVSEKVNPNAF